MMQIIFHHLHHYNNYFDIGTIKNLPNYSDVTTASERLKSPPVCLYIE